MTDWMDIERPVAPNERKPSERRVFYIPRWGRVRHRTCRGRGTVGRLIARRRAGRRRMK